MLLSRILGKHHKADPLARPQLPDGRAPETVMTASRKASCDGPDFSRHPRIWLNMGEDNSIYCPYCSRLFILGQP